MYVPPLFKEERVGVLHDAMRGAGLATLITNTAAGLIASHVPMLLDLEPAPYGTLIGHLARPNPQGRGAIGEALAIFQGPEAYITPSWYATKRETGKVVPTWNYVAVHAYGPAEFFEDADRLRAVVTRLTDLHERPRAEPWAVSDAPEPFVQAQLRGIVGIRMPITRFDGKRKMSQNRSVADRAGVAANLAESESPTDRAVAALIPVR